MSHIYLGDLPESYFVPSAADLRAQQNSLIARTQALSNAPLKTQAMRDAEEKAKRTKYPTVSYSPLFLIPTFSHSNQTTIRIKFSDRSQLQKSFPSTDKIRSVYAFVRSSLREDVKPIKFVLCSCASLLPLFGVYSSRFRRPTTQARAQGLRYCRP